jgi:hypothetical protein
MLKRYNLTRNEINDRLAYLDSHNARYSDANHTVREKENAASFMLMMKRLEENMHKVGSKGSLKDLVIQKRRLVSSQGKRFCAIKVNKFSGEEGMLFLTCRRYGQKADRRRYHEVQI